MNKVTITIIGGGSGGGRGGEGRGGSGGGGEGRGGVLGREVMINGQSPSLIF